MPARPNLRDRMAQTAPKGRDALYSGSTSTVDGQPSTVGRVPSSADRQPAAVDGQPSTVTADAAPAPGRQRVPGGGGGERINGPRSTVSRQPSTAHGGPSTVDGPNWTEAHQRVTFYCHRDLIRDIERAMGETERSKSQVIVDALRQHLGKT